MSRHRLWFVLSLLAALMLPACGPLTFTVGGSPQRQQLRTKVVEREVGLAGDRVAIIDVSGFIMNAERPSLLRQGENPVGLLHEQLAEAADDARVKGVILRINSPGGTVTASDAMYREVQRFKQQTGKPVIALIMDVGASGGYYVACAADEIVAYPTSLTGSIGVIVQTVSFKPAMDRLGIESRTYKTGANKDAGSPFTEATESHADVLQGLVNDYYDRFLAVVREKRPNIPEARFDELTDGRVLSGESAAEVGVVDRAGDLHDAFGLAKRRAGIGRANLVRYHRPLEYVGSPYASADGAGPARTELNLLQINIDQAFAAPGVRFYYLWQPVP